MRDVVPNQLWIGNVLDVADLAPIFEAEIEAIVDLALNEKPAQLTRELIYCRFPMNDGGGNSPQLLRAAVDVVVSLISKRIPTLVYCSAGISRSLAVIAVALARNLGQKPENTLVALASDQPHDVSLLLCYRATSARRVLDEMFARRRRENNK